LSWDQRFFEHRAARPGPARRKLVTLRDAALYITRLPKAEHDNPEWQAAMGVREPPKTKASFARCWPKLFAIHNPSRSARRRSKEIATSTVCGRRPGNHIRNVLVTVIGPCHIPVARARSCLHLTLSPRAGPCFARPRLALPRPAVPPQLRANRASATMGRCRLLLWLGAWQAASRRFWQFT
jgi:hypothetical protein